MLLKDGIILSLNKEADVYLCKKNEKAKCENYRPILPPNISKICERVMYTRLDNFLKFSRNHL